MCIFQELESNVRSYCRHYKDVFQYAKDSIMISENGKVFIDFFSIAGSMNYGHNNTRIKKKLIDYLQKDGIMNALDIATTAKRTFLEKFKHYILEPRNLDYKIQFCSPSGTNAIEAALKLARKKTGRTGVFALMGGFHGMSAGSLSVSGDRRKHKNLGYAANNTIFLPHPGLDIKFNTISYLNFLLENSYSGVDIPAAFIFETVQAEGGINLVSSDYLKQIRDICTKYGIILICDDIQAGCGRTGTFFSFEHAEIIPDIVAMSKSISGIGVPMSILLLRPDTDQWEPGEHSGTFRGNQLAFITATAALSYWKTKEFELEIKQKEQMISYVLEEKIRKIDSRIQVRGLGMIWGIDFVSFTNHSLAASIRELCYQNGLIIECVGENKSVLKIMPALTITNKLLSQGLKILERAITDVLKMTL